MDLNHPNSAYLADPMQWSELDHFAISGDLPAAADSAERPAADAEPDAEPDALTEPPADPGAAADANPGPVADAHPRPDADPPPADAGRADGDVRARAHLRELFALVRPKAVGMPPVVRTTRSI